jgi:hypothetical protein
MGIGSAYPARIKVSVAAEGSMRWARLAWERTPWHATQRAAWEALRQVAHCAERTNSRSAPGTVGSSGRQLSSWDRSRAFARRAVSSGMVRAQRPYEAAAREYRSRGEEVVLTVSPQGVESVTPSPGYGVSGMVVAGPACRISPTSWIGTALERKGRVDLELRRELTGNPWVRGSLVGLDKLGEPPSGVPRSVR